LAQFLRGEEVDEAADDGPQTVDCPRGCHDTPSAIGMLGDLVGQRIMSYEVCPGR
jgi:hypothetical protein